jgi:predicted 2-oxoglutarate/Fe(II)-dependent dioxygenase YbiX
MNNPTSRVWAFTNEPVAPLYLIEGILSQDECEALVDRLLVRNKWVIHPGREDGDSRQHYTLADSADSYLIDADRLIKERLLVKIEQLFGQLFFIPLNMSFNRWMVGDTLGMHNDSGMSNGELIIEKRGHEPPPVGISEHLNDVGAVVYLTDEYEGGEIFFDKKGIKLKPPAGSAVVFPASHLYRHGVTELLNGERLTMTCFWVSVRSVALTLINSIYPDWWKRVGNPENIWRLLPREVIDKIDPNMLPPLSDREEFLDFCSYLEYRDLVSLDEALGIDPGTDLLE